MQFLVRSEYRCLFVKFDNENEIHGSNSYIVPVRRYQIVVKRIYGYEYSCKMSPELGLSYS